MTAETETIEALAAELKPQLQAIADRYDAACTDDEREATAKEGVELIARRLIQQMLAKFITPENLAAFGVQEFAKGFASGGVIAGRPVPRPDLRGEYVVPKP